MVASEQGKAYLRTSEVAERIGQGGDCVRRMCEEGVFAGAYQTDGGQWRVPAGDVDAYLRERNARVKRRPKR